MLKFFPRKFHVISKKYLLAILVCNLLIHRLKKFFNVNIRFKCIVLLGIFFLNIYILPIIISISTDIIPTKTHKSIYANHGRSQEKSYESNSAALNFRYSTLLSKSLEYSNANHVILNTDRYSGVPTKRNTNFIIVVQVKFYFCIFRLIKGINFQGS
jgi:hypothetical protein